MRKRVKTKGQVLRAAALKITPALAVIVLGGNFVFQTIKDDYKGIYDLNRLNNEVVSYQNNPNGGNNDRIYRIPTTDGGEVEFEEPDLFEGEEAPEISTAMYDSGYRFANIDWQTLQSYNEDICSYIIIDNTHVSYPVVQSSNNEDYMGTNFKGEEDRAGTPFVDYRTEFENDPRALTDVTVVYGHHMSGGLMFADITEYQNQSFYNQHPFFLMYTDDGQAYRIDVAAVNVISGDDDTALHAWDFASQLDFNRYYRRILRDSEIQTNTQLEYGDKIMTLVTCVDGHGTNKRCLVIGKVTKVLVNKDLLEASKTDYNIVK